MFSGGVHIENLLTPGINIRPGWSNHSHQFTLDINMRLNICLKWSDLYMQKNMPGLICIHTAERVWPHVALTTIAYGLSDQIKNTDRCVADIVDGWAAE